MPDAATHDPGVLRRWALGTFRRLPRRGRLMVLHLLAPSHTVGALCFIEHQGRVLMLRQRHRRGWTLPGGLIDRGENAEQAVVREVREETGLAISVNLPFAVVVAPAGRRVDILFHVPVDAQVEVRASSEATEAAWLTPDDAGQVDEPTAEAFALFRRAAQPQAYRGRLLD